MNNDAQQQDLDVCAGCLHAPECHTYEHGCDWCSCPLTLGSGRVE